MTSHRTGTREQWLTASAKLLAREKELTRNGLNPGQVTRFKERYDLSGARSDPADAHAMAGMVRTGRHQLRTRPMPRRSRWSPGPIRR
jgi:hypothetical protein